ncbi:MAG TPA: putative lipid II flippase FtsW [Ktedonobacteraceae bacterium]|jgi:cell division protein FtsW|nr:putative lipid II flippase FtsW [Ktedonobacteraceae bacterium]
MLDDRAKREGQTAKTVKPTKNRPGRKALVARSPALESAERKAQLREEEGRKRRSVSGSLRQPSGALGKMSYAAEAALSQTYRAPKHLPHRRRSLIAALLPMRLKQQAVLDDALRIEGQHSVQGISVEEQQKLSELEMSLPRAAGKIDHWLLVVVLALLCVGLVMVYSASSFISARDYGDASYYFQKQMVWAFLGIIAMLVTMRIDYRQWRRFSLAGMMVVLPLLVIVLIFGRNVYGATRWIPLGPFFSFQPSELTKLVLALYIADWLARKGRRAVGTFLYGLAPFVILVGVILGLILLEKDMGTAIIIAGLATAMFFTAGANIVQFLLALLCGGAIFLSQAFSSYRFYRLKGFMDPFKDVTGINAQLYQSLLALGSGGWFGVGLGASRQKTGYLPLPYIDSIFAITGEELGFIGCTLIIMLFMFLAFRGFRLARRTQDVYGALLATGITTWLVLQAMINIGASTASIPYTGVPLPFISFGGSSLVVTMAAVGVLLNISRYIQEPDAPVLSRRTLTKTISKKKA